MNTLKRLPIKYIRDKAKKAYEKQKTCYICASGNNLDLHHVYSISELFNRWCRKQGIVIRTESDILDYREQFISEHTKEIYQDVYTLCRTCHNRLHSLFGQHPPIPTAPKQIQYIEGMLKKYGYDGQGTS